MGTLEGLPITAVNASTPQILGGLADFRRVATNAVVSQYDIQSMVQIFATPEDRDLGALANEIQSAIDRTAKDKPKGASCEIDGPGHHNDERLFGGCCSVSLALLSSSISSW